jgi:multiple RNA-binding domain-containing protein 1
VEVKDAPEALIPTDESIADTGRLMVRNITFSCTVEEIEALFKPYGPLSQVHIPIDKVTKQSKGYAFVLFLLPEHAVKAYSLVNGAIFQGRLLSIIPAREQPRSRLDIEQDDPNLSFKDKKKAEQRKNAASAVNTWNSTFINSDTVVSAMAAKLSVTKGEILDPTSENMGVRLALAETQIINETRDYLLENGVQLDAFGGGGKVERSDVCILVKNIPFETTLEEIEVCSH